MHSSIRLLYHFFLALFAPLYVSFTQLVSSFNSHSTRFSTAATVLAYEMSQSLLFDVFGRSINVALELTTKSFGLGQVLFSPAFKE